jgi:c(7)-type cytochrome triheme protein
MRSILVLALVALLGGIAHAIPAPPIISIENRKFDHAKHEGSALGATDAKRRKAECADCHQYDGTGKRKAGKEHATRCVKCHQDPATCTNTMKTSTLASNPARRCVTCHVFDRCKPAGMPMPPATDTYQAGFSHGKHIGFGMAIDKDCARCHTTQAPAGGAANIAGSGHNSCGDCHKAGGRVPQLAMTNCTGCHQPAKGRAAAPTDPFRLATFDHRKHHASSNQAACTGCHTTKKLSGPGGDLPRPDMLSCQNACHNGQRAFPAVGTTCTKCHGGTSAEKPPANRVDLAFSHATHQARNVDIAKCEACHELRPDGNLAPHGTNKNHMPCAASGCHQTEFASKTTKICGVCHDAQVPWQKVESRFRTPQKPEWFETMNHSTHLAKKGQTNAACGDCHGDKLGGGKRPGGHDACIQCHGKEPRAFPMNQCAGCHSKQAPARAVATEWSVAATFAHDKHAQDPKTKRTTECASCHADVKNAKDLASIKKPTMESCGRCHDGTTSFKTTGYECAKCHTRPKPPTPNAMLPARSGGA